ncbi:MAG: hypothetical protein LBM06_07970 [Prevotellaceae bacterium]|jgi:hypothetical protein|nr:hypothetical protein [Prevotellaceae bacterium]
MNEKKYMIECLSKDLVLLLMERQGLTMKAAFHTLYDSDTYSKLTNIHAGLYFQSPFYVYDFLKQELLTGKMG